MVFSRDRHGYQRLFRCHRLQTCFTVSMLESTMQSMELAKFTLVSDRVRLALSYLDGNAFQTLHVFLNTEVYTSVFPQRSLRRPYLTQRAAWPLRNPPPLQRSVFPFAGCGHRPRVKRPPPGISDAHGITWTRCLPASRISGREPVAHKPVNISTLKPCASMIDGTAVL
jgi:hypothetical protein